MKTGPVGEACSCCGADDWVITATLISCRNCEALWGRVNGQWILGEPGRKLGGRSDEADD
jgi:hypothetical protein